MRSVLVACLVLLSLATPAAGQADDPVSAVASVDRDSITIGDPILLSLVVELAPGWSVADPGVPRSIGDIEVIETLPALEARLAGDRMRFTFRFRITAYRVGEYEITSLELGFTGPQGEVGAARTQAIPIHVTSVLLPDEDPTTIKGLKPQLALPGLLARDLQRSALIGLGAVAFVVVAVVLIAWLRRRRATIAGDGLTPAQRALRELEALDAMSLADKARYAEHYESLTAILRRFVAEQYRLPAGERTPRELRVEMERAGVDPQQRATIFEVLREGETVRFRDGRSYPAHARGALGSALGAMRRAAAAEPATFATIESAS